MAREMIKPTNVYEPEGFSHAVKVGNTIYTSGQVGFDVEGNLIGKDDFPLQLEQAYTNLKHVLEAGGATMADIVQLTVYVTDFSKMDEIDEVWVKYLGPDFPPTTGVEVSRLSGDLMVEVNAIAVVD